MMKNLMILALTIFLTVVCITASEISTNFAPPVIFPSYKEIVVTAGYNFNLTCKGKYPLAWILPDNQLSDDEKDKAEIVIRTTEPTDDDDTYGIFMEMFNLSVVDVGFYYCAYNESEEHKGDTYDKLEAMGLAKSVYLYVEDPDALLVPSDSMIGGIQFQNLTIPCKPTSPNVDVKLFREENEKFVELKPNISLPDSRIVSYEKHSGFKIPDIGISDSSFIYYCIASHNGKNVSETYVLQVIPYVKNIPKPYIKDSFDGKVVIGGEIKLECTVHLQAGIEYYIDWLHNDETVMDKKENRINISKTTIDVNGVKKIGKSLLTVGNVTEKDGGDYTCRIKSHNIINESTKAISISSK